MHRGDGEETQHTTKTQHTTEPPDHHVESLARHAWRLRLRPHSGRRHQLRIHMASLGAPIARDSLYGGERLESVESRAESDESRVGTNESAAGGVLSDRHRSLHLHAAELAFSHPSSSERLSFRSEPPFRVEDV